MKPTPMHIWDSSEELQTREEYEIATRKMIVSEAKDLMAKIKGSSLDNLQKRTLIKDSIVILLNNLE